MNWERVAWARAWAQGMLAMAGVAIFFSVLGWMSEPAYLGYRPESVAGIPISAVEGLAIVSALVGAVWMWRIYRAPTKYDSASWRYRDGD